MTVCEVCGGDQFTLQDGFYHCNECHTQSQDIREMVTEETGVSVVLHKMVVSEKTVEKRKRMREARAEVKRLETITKAEAFNMLLQGWAARLVERGMPKTLPARLRELWTRYLQAPPTRRSTLCPRVAVVLLWLALADCSPGVLLSDVLRWSRQGIISVYSAANDLPEDVRTNYTSVMVCAERLNSRMLEEAHVGLRRQLALPPPRPGFGALLRRVQQEMALPAQLADVAANLARGATLPLFFRPDACAAATLLATLKLLLGLDDATELRNSAVAAARNATVPTGPRWFDFAAWLAFWREFRATIARSDYLALETEPGGPDPCRREHRRLLFDYFRREGVFRCKVEIQGKGRMVEKYRRPQYSLETEQLFGRPPPPAAAPPEPDLWRPLAVRLEREGGELLERANALRAAKVDFLLDETHVRRLPEVGLNVAVTRGAARPRELPPKPRVRFAQEVVLVRRRNEALGEESESVKSAETQGDTREPALNGEDLDLRLFMPNEQVWSVSDKISLSPRLSAFTREAEAWPLSFRYVFESLAAVVEMTPQEFSRYVWTVEDDMLQIVDGKVRGKTWIPKKGYLEQIELEGGEERSSAWRKMRRPPEKRRRARDSSRSSDE